MVLCFAVFIAMAPDKSVKASDRDYTVVLNINLLRRTLTIFDKSKEPTLA